MIGDTVLPPDWYIKKAVEIKMFNMFHILSCTLFVASLRFNVEERNVIFMLQDLCQQ